MLGGHGQDRCNRGATPTTCTHDTRTPAHVHSWLSSLGLQHPGRAQCLGGPGKRLVVMGPPSYWSSQIISSASSARQAESPNSQKFLLCSGPKDPVLKAGYLRLAARFQILESAGDAEEKTQPAWPHTPSSRGLAQQVCPPAGHPYRVGNNAFLSPQILREDYRMSGNVLDQRHTSRKHRGGVVKDTSCQGSNPGSIAW